MLEYAPWTCRSPLSLMNGRPDPTVVDTDMPWSMSNVMWSGSGVFHSSDLSVSPSLSSDWADRITLNVPCSEVASSAPGSIEATAFLTMSIRGLPLGERQIGLKRGAFAVVHGRQHLGGDLIKGPSATNAAHDR